MCGSLIGPRSPPLLEREAGPQLVRDLSWLLGLCCGASECVRLCGLWLCVRLCCVALCVGWRSCAAVTVDAQCVGLCVGPLYVCGHSRAPRGWLLLWALSVAVFD